LVGLLDALDALDGMDVATDVATAKRGDARLRGLEALGFGGEPDRRPPGPSRGSVRVPSLRAPSDWRIALRPAGTRSRRSDTGPTARTVTERSRRPGLRAAPCRTPGIARELRMGTRERAAASYADAQPSPESVDLQAFKRLKGLEPRPSAWQQCC
jgi:hypothetical protein